MEKLDYKKTLGELYNPPAGKITQMDVPPLTYLMADGKGNPNNSAEYAAVVEALFGLAYTLKFKLKKAGVLDFGVMPLEGLWWTPDMADFSVDDKAAWLWTMMIVQPQIVTPEMVMEAADELRRKKNPPALEKIRFETYAEGLSMQILHIGSYADEGPNIQKLHDFIAGAGYLRRGKHHEIYLGDPRRTAPEKLRTILRQPISPA
jgi:hypothetical protein